MSVFDDKVSIGYWTTRGLGAPLRMMAAYAAATKGAEYNNIYHDMAETPERKAGTADPADFNANWADDGWEDTKSALVAKNPLANLPYVLDGEKVISQSLACLVYLGEKWGLMGADPSLTLQILTEIKLDGHVGSLYTCENQEAVLGLLNKTQNTTSFAKLEALFTMNVEAGKTGPFLLGAAEPTCADFTLWEDLDLLFEMAKYCGRIQVPLTGPRFEGLKAMYKAMNAIPCIAEYRTSAAGKLPCTNKCANFGASPDFGPWIVGQETSWCSAEALGVAKVL
jgi:glutathione S-transferase